MRRRELWTKITLPTVYQWAGGASAFERLTTVFYRNVLEEEHHSIPLVIPSELSTTGNVPFVQGTPSVGTVPSVPGGGEAVAATLTAGTMAKIVVIVATCAAVIFAGIKVIPPILHHSTDTPTTGGTSVNAKTVPMPPTQISCPAPGTARAAVTALLMLGKHQNLVYTENADTGSGGGAPGILKRYDITTHQTTQIVQLATTSISDAQISTDGQWILFTSQVNGRAAIQMIRMDGQGLQTLYCAPANLATSNSSLSSLYSLTWSTDQKKVMFIQQDVSNGRSPPLYLLNLAKGTVQKELSPDSNSSITHFPRVWIDNTHIALLAEAPSGNSQGESIYVLDTKNGTNQQSNALKLIITVSTACFGFDISPDHKDFFLVRCNINSSVSSINYQGPSSITTLPVTGGSESTIYTTQTLGVRLPLICPAKSTAKNHE